MSQWFQETFKRPSDTQQYATPLEGTYSDVQAPLHYSSVRRRSSGTYSYFVCFVLSLQLQNGAMENVTASSIVSSPTDQHEPPTTLCKITHFIVFLLNTH